MGNVELNERQQEAVEATEGQVRIIAGAGSGKTRVLAHRFAFLVNEIGVSPGNILCLTFTNKAAAEMKRRIATLVDRGSVNDFICTIHSFCVKFLRREIHRLGFPKSFTVIDEDDARSLAKTAMQEFGIDRRQSTVDKFLKDIAALKGYDPAAYIQLNFLPRTGQDQAPDVKARYMQLQLKQFALDYDDLVYFTLYILERFPDAKAYWTDMLNYVMVDEVQDCSGDDWKLLREISSGHGNLFVVGDPDQAIYQWRGGNPKIFVDFKADTDVILDQNYRSTPDVLAVANNIISNNRNRVPKDLFTVRLPEQPAVYTHYRSEREEAEGIADRIAAKVAQGAEYTDFAVLYRASHLSRQIEQSLMRRQIPYSIWGGVRFFERKEIKDALCYLRLTVNENDDAAFRRIINLPSRKFGKAAMEKLQEAADSLGMPLFPTLRMLVDEGQKSFDRPPLRAFVNLIDQSNARAEVLPVSELTDTLLRVSGLLDEYRTDEDEARLENLNELMASMREFERQHVGSENPAEYSEELNAARYLQEMSLFTNADFAKDGDKVRLMTIHQSKGLEFPTVFIVGLTEGVFPSHRSIRERRDDGEEEERRLMYVAVTRAETELYLSESEGYLNENGALKYPSRFLGEIPEEYLKIEGNPDPSLLEGTKRLVETLNGQLGSGGGASANMPWPIGTRVAHRLFGEGVIISYNQAAKSYRVRFPRPASSQSSTSYTERDLLPRVLSPLS